MTVDTRAFLNASADDMAAIIRITGQERHLRMSPSARKLVERQYFTGLPNASLRSVHFRATAGQQSMDDHRDSCPVFRARN